MREFTWQSVALSLVTTFHCMKGLVTEAVMSQLECCDNSNDTMQAHSHSAVLNLAWVTAL
jgi:hypothetical protein